MTTNPATLITMYVEATPTGSKATPMANPMTA